MKTKQREDNFWHPLSKIFRRRVTRHDPTLLLNMSNFNFKDGWRRTVLEYEHPRSYA